ncbi:hypothetical protein NL676_007077 [Syzygium grande]|nr:hypothetical protein NL676_007077 [Syzygium grande]
MTFARGEHFRCDRIIWATTSRTHGSIALDDLELALLITISSRPCAFWRRNLSRERKGLSRQQIGTGINNLDVLEMSQVPIDPPLCRIPKFFCIKVATAYILRNELHLQIENIMTNDELYN